MIRKNLWVVFITLIFLSSGPACAREPTSLAKLRLPPGFHITLFAENVPGARSMALSPKGVLFVGTRGEGKVYALVDQNKDGKAEKLFTIASGLNQPNGVAFREGALYVAEASRLLRYDGIEDKLEAPPRPVVIREDFPTKRQHSWKFLAFGPDGKLYVPIGAPCNNCENPDPRFASITRMNPDGSDFEVYAQGIRNTVGFDWQPGTQQLWFTDNGRDRLGENSPPDELDRVTRAGQHFGFPYCHGGDIPDPEFGAKRKCAEFEAPMVKLGPHVAALGMRFYMGTAFPEKYRGQIFIAEHGSWNREEKIGYRVSLVTLDGQAAGKYETFAEGWLQANGTVTGRPVDVLVMLDGALLVSDDFGDAIYRITYGP